MAVDGAIVVELVVLRELPGSAPVDEFLFDGFAFGVVADDAAAAVAFEEERLKLLLQPALTVDSAGLLHRMRPQNPAGNASGNSFGAAVGCSFY